MHRHRDYSTRFASKQLCDSRPEFKQVYSGMHAAYTLCSKLQQLASVHNLTRSIGVHLHYILQFPYLPRSKQDHEYLITVVSFRHSHLLRSVFAVYLPLGQDASETAARGLQCTRYTSTTASAVSEAGVVCFLALTLCSIQCRSYGVGLARWLCTAIGEPSGRAQRRREPSRKSGKLQTAYNSGFTPGVPRFFLVGPVQLNRRRFSL